MTDREVAAILHQFNEWRRGDEDIPQPDPREIGEAIDAVVEMIDRLEAAEEDIILKERVIDSLGSTLNAVAKERDELKELNIVLCTNSNSQGTHNARLAEENYALLTALHPTRRTRRMK